MKNTNANNDENLSDYEDFSIGKNESIYDTYLQGNRENGPFSSSYKNNNNVVAIVFTFIFPFNYL